LPSTPLPKPSGGSGGTEVLGWLIGGVVGEVGGTLGIVTLDGLEVGEGTEAGLFLGR